jgi:hypothetical protein
VVEIQELDVFAGILTDGCREAFPILYLKVAVLGGRFRLNLSFQYTETNSYKQQENSEKCPYFHPLPMEYWVF